MDPKRLVSVRALVSHFRSVRIFGLAVLIVVGLAGSASAAVHEPGRPSGVWASCTKTWNGVTSTNWATATNWTPSGAPAPSDYVCISTGTNQPTITNATNATIAGMQFDSTTLTVTGTLSLADATGTKSSVMSSGTLQGTGTITVATGHIFTWIAGEMQGAGSTVVASGGTLAIDLSGGLGFAYIDRTLTNNGTMTYVPSAAGYTMNIGGGLCGTTTLTNNGTFTYNGTNASDFGIGACGTATITNNGTFTKATGSATPPIGPLFNNAGVVSAQAGTLALSGGGGSGTGTFGATGGGKVSIASGTFNMGNGSTFTGGVSIDGGAVNVLSGATLTLSGANSFTGGTIDGPGTMTVNGTLTWNSGEMQGAGTTVVANGGTLAIDLSGGLGFAYIDRTLTNNGTMTYVPSVAGYTMTIGGGVCGTTTLTNNGTFTYNGTNASDFGIGACGTATIVNNGTFSRATGSESVQIAPAVENDGSLTANAGTLSFIGGGSGTSTGQFGTNGGGKISLDGGTFHLGAGASFSGEGAIGGSQVFVDGGVSVANMTFSGGTIDGSGTMTVNGTLTWNAGEMQGAGSTVVANGGTIAVDLSGNLGFAYVDRTLTNNGTMTYVPSPAGYTLSIGSGLCGTTTLTNNGTFTYNGTNASDFGIGACGAATITNNGTFTRATGTAIAQILPAFDNSGTIGANAGTLQFQGAFPSFNGTDTLLKGSYLVSAKLQFPSANVVTNAGTIVLDGTGAQIQDTSGTNALANFATNSATGSLTVKNGKSLTTKAFTNAGAIVIGPGTGSTLTAPTTYTQSGGSTSLTAATSKLVASGASGKVVINGGTLSGIGTVQAAGSPGLTNAATVSPGLSPGTMTLTGSYSQSAAGNLPIEIGGIGAGQFDVLNASGAATLNGTLSLSTVNGFTPTIGQTFTIMTYASHTGCFTTINGRNLGAVGAGMFYDVACNPTNVVVTVKRAELSINDVTLAEGDSGTTNASFTVSLNTSRPDLAMSVSYATADGTATAPGDYTSTSGSLNWAAGDGTSRTIVVPVVGDTLDEVDETYFVNLSGGSNVFLLDAQGLGTITDNDPPPSISIDDVSSAEGNSGTKLFTFTVSLSVPSGKTATVDYATADGTAQAGSDYVATSGTLSFAAGVTSKTVKVTVNGDTSLEPDETFFANLSNASNATIADTQGLGTIENDDAQLPVITGFQPAAQVVGKAVSILGSHFTGATEVDFAKAGGGVVKVTTFTSVTDTTIALKVPKLATTGVVSVTTPAGTGVSSTQFKVKPKIKTFSPTSGPVGTLVTITGTSFTGTTKVQFNGVNAVFTVVSDSKITVTVPAGATTGKISVTTPGGKGSSKLVFTVT